MKHPKHIWFAVDENGSEWLSQTKPYKHKLRGGWYTTTFVYVQLPSGTIQHITGKTLTWEDKPLKWKPTTNIKGLILNYEEMRQPIEDALYATKKFLTTEASDLASDILDYITDAGFIIIKNR